MTSRDPKRLSFVLKFVTCDFITKAPLVNFDFLKPGIPARLSQGGGPGHPHSGDQVEELRFPCPHSARDQGVTRAPGRVIHASKLSADISLHRNGRLVLFSAAF